MMSALDFDADETEAFCTCAGHIGPRKLPRSAFRERDDRPCGVRSWCRACESRARERRRRHAIWRMRIESIISTLPE